MKTYRVSVPAVLNFTVAANSKEEAKRIAAAMANSPDSARFDYDDNIPDGQTWFQVWVDLWDSVGQKCDLTAVTILDSFDEPDGAVMDLLVAEAKQEACMAGGEKDLPEWMQDKATA